MKMADYQKKCKACQSSNVLRMSVSEYVEHDTNHRNEHWKCNQCSWEWWDVYKQIWRFVYSRQPGLLED